MLKNELESTHRVEPFAKNVAATWRMLKYLIQHFLCSRQVGALFAISGNAKESFNPILDPDADPDHRQNLITSKFAEV